MSELRPAYFVVQRRFGHEQPAIYWDDLPRSPLPGLVYVVRLDQLPNAEANCAAPLSKLYEVFCRLRPLGKLPPRWDPKNA
jgi:hypothetical protein